MHVHSCAAGPIRDPGPFPSFKCTGQAQSVYRRFKANWRTPINGLPIDERLLLFWYHCAALLDRRVFCLANACSRHHALVEDALHTGLWHYLLSACRHHAECKLHSWYTHQTNLVATCHVCKGFLCQRLAIGMVARNRRDSGKEAGPSDDPKTFLTLVVDR